MTDILLASEKQNQERVDNIAKRTSNEASPANQSSAVGLSAYDNQSSDDKLAPIDGQSVPAAPELSSQSTKSNKTDYLPNAEPSEANNLSSAASSSSDDSRGHYRLPMAGGVQLTSPANLSQLIDQAPVFSNWTAWPNEIFDKVLPLLKPQDQVVLLRLYRLSRGFKNDTCLVTVNKLASSCNISGREVYRSIERLESKGLVKRVSVDFNNKNLHERGTTFKVNLPMVNTARQAGGVKQSPPVKQSPDDQRADIKYINTKDTHKHSDPHG